MTQRFARRGLLAGAIAFFMGMVAFWAVPFGAVQAAGAAGSGATAQSATRPKPQSIAEKIAASKDLLDINTAPAEQLRALPGMGDAYAARVIAGRPYTAKNQLTTRGILPQAEYERINDLIIAHRPKP